MGRRKADEWTSWTTTVDQCDRQHVYVIIKLAHQAPHAQSTLCHLGVQYNLTPLLE